MIKDILLKNFDSDPKNYVNLAIHALLFDVITENEVMDMYDQYKAGDDVADIGYFFIKSIRQCGFSTNYITHRDQGKLASKCDFVLWLLLNQISNGMFYNILKKTFLEYELELEIEKLK